MATETTAEMLVKIEGASDGTPRCHPILYPSSRQLSVFKQVDPSQSIDQAETSPASTCTGMNGHLSPNVSQSELKSLLEDTLAQLEAARQQRTEVSSELFKYRRIVDELKEQQASLQAEMGRRLQTHRLDVNRLQDVQRDLDSLRQAYSEKQGECIDLASKLQQVTARIASEDQQQQLKEENQLLWQRIDELRRVADAVRNDEQLVQDVQSQLQSLHELHVGQPLPAIKGVPLPELVADTIGAIEAALTADLDAAKTESSKLRMALARLQKQQHDAPNDLEQQAAEWAKKFHSLSTELENTKRRLAGAEMERDQLQCSLETVKRSSSELTEVPELREELRSLRNKLRQTETSLVEREGDLSHLRSQFDSSQTVIAKEREDFREQSEKLWSTEASLEQTIARLKESCEELSSAKGRALQIERERSVLAEEAETLRLEIAELRVHVAEAEQNEHMQRLLGEEKQRTRQLEQEIAERNMNIERLMQEKEQVEGSLATAHTEITDLERQVKQYQEEIKEAQNEQIAQKKELEAARDSILDLKTESGSLKDELHMLSEKLDRDNVRLKELQDRCEAEAAQSRERIAVLEEELVEAVNGPDLAAVLSEVQLESLPLPRQVQKLKAAVLKLVAEKRAKERLVESYRDDIETQRRSTELLKEQQGQKELEWQQEYEGYTDNLHRVKKQLELASQESQKLQCELQNAKSRLRAAEAAVRRAGDTASAGSSGKKARGYSERPPDELNKVSLKAEQRRAELVAHEGVYERKLAELKRQHYALQVQRLGLVTAAAVVAWLAFLYGGLSC